MTFYRDHIANASPEARAKHFLIIGPWDHAGTRTPTDEVGGVKFGQRAVVDLNDLHRQWYDWTMKNGAEAGVPEKSGCLLFDRGGNSGANGEWKYADSYDNLIANPKTFYLDSKNGDANGVFRSGALAETKPNEGADKFVNDPLDTRRGEETEGVEPNDKTAGIDQRFALCIGNDGLVYHTDPLPKETPLIGCPTLPFGFRSTHRISICRRTFTKFSPTERASRFGATFAGCVIAIRCAKPRLVKPGEIVKCDFDPGLFVARRLMKGSRLRLVVYRRIRSFGRKTTTREASLPTKQRKDARTAHVKIYHDAKHASAIEFRCASRLLHIRRCLGKFVSEYYSAVDLPSMKSLCSQQKISSTLSTSINTRSC